MMNAIKHLMNGPFFGLTGSGPEGSVAPAPGGPAALNNGGTASSAINNAQNAQSPGAAAAGGAADRQSVPGLSSLSHRGEFQALVLLSRAFCLLMAHSAHFKGTKPRSFMQAPDFVMGDVNDKRMGGIIDSFPSLYASKAGRTDDETYIRCAKAYLGLQCAATFRACPLPIGSSFMESMPPCITGCLLAVAACPGFWFGDVSGDCTSPSIPPFCSFASFAKTHLIPPQLSSFDDANPYPKDCPDYDEELDGVVGEGPPIESPIHTAYEESIELGDDLDDFLSKQSDGIRKPCNCQCYKKMPRPECQDTEQLAFVLFVLLKKKAEHL
uniref:FZ domain-containing protein n=1 Tax=Chromera velia CCMP2878 TaxID=1169474 RepID=A0A0G4F1W6_9ALVE|eukprot:Cvel_14652.t1-p1 / transcript=Cvel_14652.t1 / gene=Cvel_14652 / organism=Chromera_velia_CCMP2878 / gene_product=hypothetical protein / transcript_product=hypothetical protein / location=Cvel_scaffold1049:49971-51500(-) / protein_length=325 / sequence_SO=supercontig / SO=protein_coding / is_pseudo=false